MKMIEERFSKFYKFILIITVFNGAHYLLTKNAYQNFLINKAFVNNFYISFTDSLYISIGELFFQNYFSFSLPYHIGSFVVISCISILFFLIIKYDRFINNSTTIFIYIFYLVFFILPYIMLIDIYKLSQNETLVLIYLIFLIPKTIVLFAVVFSTSTSTLIKRLNKIEHV